MALLWRPGGGPPQPAQQEASVEVELVDQAATQRGQPTPPPIAPPPTPAPTPDPIIASPPTPPGPAPPGPASPPQPAASAPPAQAAPPAPAAPAAPQTPVVNLGNGDEDRDALSVTGDDVVSEGPDSRYHNLPPHYPRDAARAHETGSVALIIHITADGAAGEIEVTRSSGIASLDESARDAVSRWRFKPPVRDGVPVRSVYLLQFNFVGNQP